VLSLSVLFLVNFGTTVANYNVDAYQKGKLSTVDVEALESLGDSAIPALVRLEDLLEEKAASDKNAAILLEQASTTLDRLQEARKTQERGVMDLTIPNLLADHALQKR
jgi:glycine cleavage system pyridoxal-binding protein P